MEFSMIKILTKYSAFLLVLISIAACSELNENIPPVPEVKTHNSGFADTSSSDFHGKYIMNHNWDMISCQSCHGENYSGGSAPTCLNCHTYAGGPENCTTCHGSSTSGAPPKDINGNTSTSERGVGAHQIHLNGNSDGRAVACSECHSVPGGVYSVGHVDSDLPAEVLMNNPRANVTTNDDSSQFNYFDIDPNQIRYIPNPVYNSSDLTCSNTYCHGYFKNGNIDNIPVWTEPATSACGSCHGDGSSPLPKISGAGGSHPNSLNCSLCHGGVVDVNLNIINPSKHIDGLLNLAGNDIEF
jgi:predicted CxxxxCH...CXXCH cytochrome family protein